MLLGLYFQFSVSILPEHRRPWELAFVPGGPTPFCQPWASLGKSGVDAVCAELPEHQGQPGLYLLLIPPVVILCRSQLQSPPSLVSLAESKNRGFYSF